MSTEDLTSLSDSQFRGLLAENLADVPEAKRDEILTKIFDYYQRTGSRPQTRETLGVSLKALSKRWLA